MRFEFGTNGNPHAHGVAYVPGNPEFDYIVKDAATKLKMQEKAHHSIESMDIRTHDEAEKEVAAFYDRYVRETHPCKDPSGQPQWNFRAPLYELHVDNVPLPGGARPLTVSLLDVLDNVFYDEKGEEREEPDTS